MEMEVGDSTNQDLDLIDILWKQDIDLGARREVFDYNHRQKEHELQRQRQLEEEKRLHLLREQEKALLAQLKLDEETGEYIPHTKPILPPQQAVISIEITQDANFTEETGDGMSFDECLQLLAETFPVGETENPAVCMELPPVYASGNTMMSPEQPALTPAVLPSQLTPPQRVTPDLEEAWMEILSLPELQGFKMQVDETMETTNYPLQTSPAVQNPNYPNHQLIQNTPYYPMPSASDLKTKNSNVGPAEYMSACDGPVPSMAPSDINRMNVEAPQVVNANFTPDSFCPNVFYPNTILEESSSQHGLEENENVPDIPSKPSFTPMDLYTLSPEDVFDRSKRLPADFPDSDSGISTHSSPHASSPSKSVYEGGSYGFSDSEIDDLDHNPGSAESDYSEMFCLNFQPDDLEPAIPESALTGQCKQLDKKPKQHMEDPAEESGHSSTPFTKDKPKKRSDVRLSRDEQRAKALKIPFTVNMIINLPVDDFNEMMSKHELNEAQLALVRDIRRRGKNKVAAQNCRKRKMENIVGLEHELDSLKEEKDRLLDEKSKNATNLKEMKRQLNSLYLEVFGKLKDEKGNSYSPSEYSLQQSTDGSIFLVPRMKKTFKI
ncbi:Nuclear factor erythroid 2-related factor 2 [Oryzias melastigma]|uniref:Nuclear factor erythroid 2-related factor 2 n=1 Tax=Oryzias melastigma TaxID=30732 RepID=A0A834C8A1_ORYME|nr:Nuclear factor erythroid 2-related factor 2 [Oryzias melastigma]